jgi:hypothetical protein
METVNLPPPNTSQVPSPGVTQNIPTAVAIKPIQDVPIIMMRVPGWSITFPITEGTECLLIFADMCIDGWWQNGGINAQFDRRRHDLSDAFALFGPWSQPNNLSNYSQSSLQIRSDDQSVLIDLAATVATVQAPNVIIKQSGGAAQPLLNQAWYDWYTTNIQPFLVGLGYVGPPAPITSLSLTQVLEAQ